MKQINIDYRINSKVYFVEMIEKPHVVKCTMCLGDKFLYRKNETKVKCSKCEGTGEISNSGSLIYSVNSGNLYKIVYTMEKDYARFEYFVDLDNHCTFKDVDTIFKTKQEAISECEKKNKNCMMGYGPINKI